MSGILSDPHLGRRWRQARFNPIRSLTPATLTTALDQFDLGYLRQAALLWEVIEQRDDVLQIAAPKRRKAVSRRPWEIVPQDKKNAEALKHAEVLTDFWRGIRVVDAADENRTGGFALLVRQMMTAVFYGYAAHEIVWQPEVGGNQPAKLGAEFRFAPLYFFENTTGRLRYVGPEGGLAHGAELPEDEWLISAADSALMKAASICYLFKRLSLQDWLNFSEKFGIPGIHGETNATHGSEQWNNFVDALDTYASDWITATSMGEKVNLIETKVTGDAPFAPMVERMDRRLAALCRGADLSTLSRGGENTGASLQGDEQDILMEDDCEWIAETLERISRQVLAWTFGEGVQPMARLVIHPPSNTDTRTEIEVDSFLRDSGVPLGIADVLERYGRSLPEKGEELLEKPAAPAVGPEKPGTPKPGDEAAENDSVLDRFSRELGAPRAWLLPAADLFAQIESEAARGDLSHAELLDFAEQAAERLPELLTPELVLDLARPLETRMSAAVLQGAAEGLRKKVKFVKSAELVRSVETRSPAKAT